MLSVRTNTLRADNPIRFGNQGNYLTFAPHGFAGSENPHHSWNDGYVANLQMRILAIAEDTQLQIEVDPYLVADKLLFQTMNVYINGLWIGFLRAQANERFMVDLPADFIVPTANRLSFVMPNATRPSDIGEGRDQRRLAFSFREIGLVRAA
jgi:hypothetical protein